MRIHTTGGALNSAASWAAKLSPTKPVMPVLGGVLLDAGDELRISASDFNVFGTVTAAGTVVEEGRAVVSARLLAAVTGTLKATADVTVASDATTGGRLEVRCGRSRWALPQMESDEWPMFPNVGDPIGKVPAETLRHALARVLPAVDKVDAQPPVLAGVAVNIAETLTLVGTDRYRLAAAALQWQPALGVEHHQIVVPGDVLRTALGAIHDSHGDVSLCTDGNTFGVVTDQHRVLGRLMGGDFPKWQGFLSGPEEHAATIATVQVGPLLDAVNGVSVVLADKEALALDFTEGGIGISPALGDQGEADTTVDCHAWTGPSISLGLAHHLLRDALTCLASDFAVLTFTANPNRPFLLRPANEQGEVIDDGYGHVLMPMRLSGVQRARAAA